MELIGFIQVFNIIVIGIGTLLYMCCRSLTFSSSSSSSVDSAVADCAAVADDEDADIPPRREKYDVFISFRGEDTRLGVTSHLHAALLQKKIETYIDNRLERGEEIGPALLEAIEKSTISVIIFSQNYASSTWCLDELVHILKCNNTEGRMVIPVFYDINPSHVRKQHGSYADAFARLEKRFDNSIDKVHKWRDALTTAANLSGFDYSSKSGTEADLIQKVVDHIWIQLCRKSSCNLNGFVGIESRIKQIELLLGIHSQDACITVGIWGMGGIGKTTLAEAVFRRHSSKFEAYCFLKNVRENSEQAGGLDHLEKTLLKEILKEEVLPVGSTLVQERLSRTKVLIVLDDVSSPMQMEHLAGDHLRYGTGSRIIITTRDRGTLGQTVEEDNMYEVEVLKPDDALQLFCSRASNNNSTRRTDYKELAKKVVAYAKGVPLALTVLGSLFGNCKSKEEWEDEFNKLKRFPSKDIQKVLRISYDRLGENEKEMFLDIACFHKGEPVDEVKRMLDACGFFATSGIKLLIDASFISFVSKWERETIEMHDLLQEMGRTIVQEQCIKDPGKWNRLFTDEDVYRVLKSNKETPNIEAIRVHWSYIAERPLKRVDFKVMSNLRLLIVYDGHKLNASLDLPDSLRYLYCDWYPLESLPSNFCPENLVELHMPYSEVKKLWREDQILVNLQVIDLRHSINLTEVPNLSGSLKIVHINLNGCFSLVEIPGCFQHLDKLTHLHLQDCTSLKYLPKMPGNIQYLNLRGAGIKELVEIPGCFQHLDKLTHLHLQDCTSLKYLPKMPGNIQYLNLRGAGIKELPESVWSDGNISYLNISHCEDLEKLPSNNCELKVSNVLGIESCKSLGEFSELPRDITKLSLVNFKRLVSIPTHICKLKHLEELNLSGCSKLENFPEILEPMEHLVSLSLKGTAVEMLPDGLVCSTSLQEINLSGTKVRSIPASIKQAFRLSKLSLVGCKQLQSLPELPVLCNVEAQGCTSLKTVSSTRTAVTQGWVKHDHFFRDFTNCPKLDNNARRNIMEEAQIRIMREAPSAPSKDTPLPKIMVVCPGKEIPNWFSYQNEGSSVNVDLPQGWFRTGLFGFALSVVVSGFSEECDFKKVRANFIVKLRGKSHELFTSVFYIPQDSRRNDYGYDQYHVLVWNEAFSERVAEKRAPYVYKLARKASVDFYPMASSVKSSYFLRLSNPAGSLPPSKPIKRMKVESCGICPLYAEKFEKFKFDHVFMSTKPKVEEETRQDDDSEGGRSRDEPEVCGSSEESEANDGHEYGSYGEACASSGAEANDSHEYGSYGFEVSGTEYDSDFLIQQSYKHLVQ